MLVTSPSVSGLPPNLNGMRGLFNSRYIILPNSGPSSTDYPLLVVCKKQRRVSDSPKAAFHTASPCPYPLKHISRESLGGLRIYSIVACVFFFSLNGTEIRGHDRWR